MRVVEKAIEKTGSMAKLAERLTELTGHSYTKSHVQYWKRTGYFPADLAYVVASEIMLGEISPRQACPKLKVAK